MGRTGEIVVCIYRGFMKFRYLIVTITAPIVMARQVAFINNMLHW